MFDKRWVEPKADNISRDGREKRRSLSLSRFEIVRKHETTILKGIFLVSLLVLILLGSTILMVQVLNSNPRSDIQTTGWQRTPEIRIVMDSTADWARIMFNDIYGTNTNGIRVLKFDAHGWLSGNDSGDRIDAGHGLTFVDVRYNGTVTETGDIVGFFKGNNNFRHTKMYVDVVLDVDMGMNSVYVYLMLAGAGTTTFQFINKGTGIVVWQDSDTGRTFTEYVLRSMPPQVFFTTEEIDTILVLALVIGGLISIIVLNPLPLRRLTETETTDDSVGL
jgi:hypothetical protein